jgi:O-antigen/teichoic acid export membrane protein
MILAFEIHAIIAQNILKNPNKAEYKSSIKYTFFFGVLIYSFILLGSFGTPTISQPSSTDNPT